MCSARIQTAKDFFQLDRIGFIVNHRSGRGRNRDALLRTIESVRSQGHDVRIYECPSAPARPVAAALKDECSVIVACGGDGTVGGVAAAMCKSGATLAVFPVGTLNHFAVDLGIKDLATAEQALLTGKPRQIDVATVNDRVFINNSGIGIYPAIVLEREAIRGRGIPKWPAFLIGCCKALFNLPFLRLHLEADGVTISRVTPFLFVGNNAYEMHGRNLGRRARLDGSELIVFTARHSGPTGLVRIAFRAIASRLQEGRDLTVLKPTALTVRTRRASRLHVSLDGEVVRMTTPLRYAIQPGALKVLAP